MTATEITSGPFDAIAAFEQLEDPATDTQQQPEQEQPETAEEPAENDSEQEEKEDGNPDEAETEDEESEAQELHTVKVDGKEIQVPLDELINGYQRNADYTRKTQAVAEERKAVTAELEAVRGERAQYSQVLGQLQQQIQQAEPQIDWATLERENPAEWTRQKLLQQERRQALSQIEAEQARISAIQQAEQEKALSEQLAAESQKLMEAIPEWKDEKKARAEKADMVKYAQKFGYSPEELAQVNDHRPLLMLRKAMQYDALMEKRATLQPNPAKPSTKPATPGPASVPSKSTELAKAHKRLATTGKVADAAAIFERYL